MNVVIGLPAKYNLLIDQGSTLRLQVTWTDPAGAPINLTGYRVLFQIRREANADTPLLSFDSAALTTGQTLGVLGSSGLIDVTVSDELTAELPAEVAVWDLLVESSGGVRDKLLFGKAIIRPTVTR